MRSTAATIPLGLIPLAARVPAQQAMVGPTGGLPGIRFAGLEEFTADDLLSRIARDPRSILLGQPDASRERWLEFIRVHCTEACRAPARHAAWVDVRWDAAGHPIVAIDSNPFTLRFDAASETHSLRCSE